MPKLHYKATLVFQIGIFLSLMPIAQSQNQEIEKYLSTLSNSIQVSIKAETQSGQLIFQQNANKRLPSASIIKVPILIELFRKIETGDIKWNEKYTLKETDKVGGAGTIQNHETGTIFTLKELAIAMIIASDNTATNILIRKTGMENVNGLLKEYNLPQTSLQREMMDFDAIKKGRQNYTSAEDMNCIYKLLLTEELLTKKWTRKTLKILEQCEDKTTIPNLLPSNLRIAHKTGTLDYVRGDSGVLFTGKDPIILSILVEGFESLEQAEGIIARLAELVVKSRKN